MVGHHIPELSQQLGLQPELLTGSRPVYIATCLAIMGAPLAAAAALHQLPAAALWQQASQAAASAWSQARGGSSGGGGGGGAAAAQYAAAPAAETPAGAGFVGSAYG